MQKLFHLHRLDATNRKRVLQYLLKRVLRSKTSLEERIANEYYAHLIRHQGFLKAETSTAFTAYYPKLDVTLETRKRPSSDLDVFTQIYSYQEYQPLVQLFNTHFPESESMNIIDAGSNIGLTTVFLSKHYPNAQFIAVEPDSDNFDRMAANFKHNQITKVEKVKGGVWSQNAYLKIISDFRDKNHW